MDELRRAAGITEGFQEEEAKRRKSHIESRMRHLVFQLHSRSSGAVFGSWKHLWEAGRRTRNAMARSNLRRRRRFLRAGMSAWAAVARAEVRQRQARDVEELKTALSELKTSVGGADHEPKVRRPIRPQCLS